MTTGTPLTPLLSAAWTGTASSTEFEARHHTLELNKYTGTPTGSLLRVDAAALYPAGNEVTGGNVSQVAPSRGVTKEHISSHYPRSIELDEDFDIDVDIDDTFGGKSGRSRIKGRGRRLSHSPYDAI